MKNPYCLKHAVIIVALCLHVTTHCFSQGVAVNTSGAAADASAILDITSDNKGILIPRMTETQKGLIPSPATGLMIYQTDGITGFWYYNGTNWVQSIGATGATGQAGAVGATGATGAVGATGFLAPANVAGNTPYWDGTNWIVNSSNIFNNGGPVGIGTNNPDGSAKIDITSTNSGLLIPRMTTAERNAIQNPAIGLQIFNTDCENIDIYVSSGWKSLNQSEFAPISPTSGTHNSTKNQITWNWTTVSGATGYKYNTVNNYSTATNNGTDTTYAQSGLTCNTSYALYVWAYNNCGSSTELILTESTTACFTCGDNFTDSRDANAYQTVQIGVQCWMKENLNYSSANSWCYDNNSSNCATYGRLYNWYAAMAGSSSSSSNPSGIQGICPSGWHLPSDAEWKQLEMHLGMSQTEADATDWRGSNNEGGQLKESGISHWTSPNPGATNSSGFNALPGGYRLADGSSNNIGLAGYWWSATVDGSLAWRRVMDYVSATINRSTDNKDFGYAVRCLRD